MANRQHEIPQPGRCEDSVIVQVSCSLPSSLFSVPRMLLCSHIPGNDSGPLSRTLSTTQRAATRSSSKPGNYYGNLIVGKPVTLRASDWNSPPVLVTGNGSPGVIVAANGAGIDGMVIAGNASYGLLLKSDNNKIYNVTVSGFSHGIGLQSAIHNELVRNRLVDQRYRNRDRPRLAGQYRLPELFRQHVDGCRSKNKRCRMVKSRRGSTSMPGRNLSGSLGNYWKKYTGTMLMATGSATSRSGSAGFWVRWRWAE